MLVVFGEAMGMLKHPPQGEAATEFKEHLIECKRCKQEYPSNNFVIVSNNSYSSNCKNCREDLRKGGERRKIQKVLRAR